MIFRTNVRDCLYLNWALPASALPPAPNPLRYDVREFAGEPVVFASALLFRQASLEVPKVPLPRLEAPQFQLHVCTLDADGVPSVLIRAVLVPAWFAPGARWMTGQPARGARFSYPETTADSSSWDWEVRRGARLEVAGEIGSPLPGVGPDLGTWDQTVAFFRRRGLGFTESLRGLRRMEIRRAKAEVTPVRVRIGEAGLLLRYLPGLDADGLPALHSAWLCGPMGVSYVVGEDERAAVGSQVPAPG
ncbi:MAG: DUF2071 domain-containing protein [Acidobacteriota bacterium]|nr:DUF2071 domain-containing protein [Acidobacteriota bacterium]